MKMYYKYLTRAILCASCIACIGCKNSNTFEDDLKLFLSMKVNLPLERMKIIGTDSCNSKVIENKDWKLVVYTSPYRCAPCVVNSMHHWNEFIEWEENFQGKFELIFIFQPERKDKTQLISSLQMSRLKSEFYVDTIGFFTEANPRFPTDEKLHVFLLNKDNHVVLAGNPVENKNMKALIKQTIENK